MKDKLEMLSKGRTGKTLLEVLEDVKRQVADIRTPLKIKPEISNEVRLGIIEAIDIFLVDRIRVLGNIVEAPDPDEHQ